MYRQTIDIRVLIYMVKHTHTITQYAKLYCIYVLNIQCNGKELRWRHIVDLYYRNMGAVKSTPGLSLLPKLTYEHIMLTSFSKMRVDLAAQVNACEVNS